MLFGSTAFDSFKDSGVWIRRIQSWDSVDTDWLNLGRAAVLHPRGRNAVRARDDGHRHPATATGGWSCRLQFAHSLIPIIVGYIVAHYLSYLVEVGQQTVIYLSDPFSTGANYLGTANRAVNYWLTYHPTFLAVTKVGGGHRRHVLAVIAAHDRAVKLLPKRHQLTGQLPLLVVMVGFTIGGLYLLFGA